MNAIKPNTIVILTTLSAVSSFAQSSELTLTTAFADTPDPGAHPISTLVYSKLVSNNLAVGEDSAGQASIVGNVDKTMWDATRIRTNVLSLTIPCTEIVMDNDRASFSVYAPMQSMNGALSFAGYVSRSRLNDSPVTLFQVLSFAAKRQINTEFAYSVKVDKYSKFDSAITYRLNPSSGADKPGVIVSVRYSLKL